MLTMGRTLQRRVQGLVVLTTMMVVALMFRLPYISDSSDSSHNVHQRREFIPYLIDSERVADGRKLSASFESRIQYENSNSEETGRLGAKNISLPKRTHQDSGFSIFKTDDTAKNKTVGANVDSHIRKESERKDGVASVALCDNECERFRKLIDSWPADRPRAGFYYLTKPSRLSRLNASLSSVDTYFNNRFHYPVIVFHEDDLNPYLDAIRSMTKSDVFFQRVQFITPDFLTKPIPKQIPCISSISYRFMCRFHAKLVYELPIIRSLQYYWRLDDDSLLLSDVTYDVFPLHGTPFAAVRLPVASLGRHLVRTGSVGVDRTVRTRTQRDHPLLPVVDQGLAVLQ